MNSEVSNYLQRTNKSSVVAFIASFLFCFSYWLYLWTYSETLIIFDGITFDNFGRYVYEHGWQAYFEVGPIVEPFYLLIIGFSNYLKDVLGGDYLSYQIVLQIGLLFVGQCSVLYLLYRLKVKKIIAFPIYLYIGLSPALLTATFSLYSEIVAIGLLPLSVVFLSRAWLFLYDQRWWILICASLGAGITLFAVAVTKAPYEYVTYLSVMPFWFLAFRSWYMKNRYLAVKALVAGLLIVVVSGGGVQMIKIVSNQLNGNYALRCCGEEVLFATTYRRTENLNENLYFKRIGYQADINMLWPQLTYVIGGGLCYKHFSKEECDYNTHKPIDVYGFEILPTKLADITSDRRDRETIKLAVGNIFSNPGQYIGLTMLEMVKMLLWETSKKDFVRWPGWLEQLYSSVYRLALRGAISVATCIAVSYLILGMYKRVRRWKIGGIWDEEATILMFVTIIICSAIGLYSLFFVPIRSAFPLAPLYAICFGVFISKVTFKRIRVEK